MGFKVGKFLAIVLVTAFCYSHAIAQTDTLRVMTYNVLYYGDNPPCQAPHETLHGYLKTIINYTKPDILGLEKMAAPVSADNKFGTAPVGFPDSIVSYALNAAIPGRYAFCPYSNNAHSNNICVLFYNQEKLGFVSIVASYSNIIDFNTYKLYYKDANLATTHDTTFLYVTLNHDKSGDEFEAVRGVQIKAEMKNIQLHFSSLPNMINMGDFNTRGSKEGCYQVLVFPEDTAFRFFDPPFADGALKYPANWDEDRTGFAAYLTTSTRKTEGVPNDCGTAGGAKNWYDHIFLSSWIMNNENRIQYIPHSYRTIGNDGHRYKIAVNDKNSINTSAPADVIESLYEMSNKYPVMVDLVVSPHASAKHPNPEINYTGAALKEELKVISAEKEEIVVQFSDGMIGDEMMMECIDAKGNSLFTRNFIVKKTEKHFVCKLDAGTYRIRFSTKHSFVSEETVTVK